MQKYFSEFIGTFALVFCGTGAIVIDQQSGGVVTHVGVAITFGLIVLAMIYTFGEISGAHLNPANISQVWIYLTAPVLGAMLASLLGKTVFSNTHRL